MAVCRGKASEGLDFANADARTVLVVGIPFPSMSSPQVVLKKSFLDSRCKLAHSLDGQMWYSQQAFRALNQAVGRAVRHRNDYGSVLLLDERYGDTDNMLKMAKWVRPVLRTRDSVGVPKDLECAYQAGLANGTLSRMRIPRSTLPGVPISRVLFSLSEFFVHLAWNDPSKIPIQSEEDEAVVLSACPCSRCHLARARLTGCAGGGSRSGVEKSSPHAADPVENEARAPPEPSESKLSNVPSIAILMFGDQAVKFVKEDWENG